MTHHIESLMNNFADVNSKFFNSPDFPFKLFFLKVTSFLFFLLENLTITRSLHLILWHASRSPAETGVPVMEYRFFKLHVVDIFRYRIYLYHFSRKALRRVHSVSLQCFYFFGEKFRSVFLNLEVRFARSSWIEFTVSNSSISSSLVSFSNCFLVRTTIF